MRKLSTLFTRAGHVLKAISLLVGAFFLTNALSSLAFMEGLNTQGWIVYVESFVFLVGFTFLMRGDEKRADTSMELLQTLGFLGTMMGFTIFLQKWGGSSSTDISGIMLAFLTTGQALLLNGILLLLSYGTPEEGS